MPQLICYPLSRIHANCGESCCADRKPAVYMLVWELQKGEAEQLSEKQFLRMNDHILFKKEICVN